MLDFQKKLEIANKFNESLTFKNNFKLNDQHFVCKGKFPLLNKKEIRNEIKKNFNVIKIESNSNDFYIAFQDYVILFQFHNTKYSGHAQFSCLCSIKNF